LSASVPSGHTRFWAAFTTNIAESNFRYTQPITARGRVTQESFNCTIRLGDVQVRHGDVIVADVNGIVVICPERLDDVVRQAESLMDKEERMKADLLAGMDVLEMDRKYNYEQMLDK
jgi:4-hydroxy-4-methyl-2-oxoglutarate aldolase